MGTRARLSIALLLLALLGASACSSSGSSSKSTSNSKSTSTTTKTYSISTSEGEASVSLDGKLPAGWPQGFPVPSGADAAGSGSVAGKSEGVMVGVYTLSGSAQDAYNFYKSNSQLTVTSSSSVGSNKAFVGMVSFKGSYDGSVTIGAVGDTNGLVVVLNTGGTTGSSSSTTAA
ncbi:MAG TPA: hypothetical protein VIB48_01460 [Acidimicrobiia bacterium]|jgi:hypothetical protein